MLSARDVKVIDIALKADDPIRVELPVAAELAAAGKACIVAARFESSLRNRAAQW